eukprot:8913978-Lingulodinium_polyedra.AAC.1
MMILDATAAGSGPLPQLTHARYNWTLVPATSTRATRAPRNSAGANCLEEYPATDATTGQTETRKDT